MYHLEKLSRTKVTFLEIYKIFSNMMGFILKIHPENSIEALLRLVLPQFSVPIAASEAECGGAIANKQ